MASAPRLTEGTHVLNSDNFAIYPGSHLIRFSRSLLGRGASITASNLQRQYALQRGRLDGCLDSRQLTPLAAALQLQGLGRCGSWGTINRGAGGKKICGPFLTRLRAFYNLWQHRHWRLQQEVPLAGWQTLPNTPQ
jgi:hypothetical protein